MKIIKTKIYKNIDLIIIYIWSILTLAMPSFVAIPVVLFFPGYLLLIVLFPKKIKLPEMIGLSLGLSIVVISSIGLLLNSTIGLRLQYIIISLLIYTIIFIILTIYRRMPDVDLYLNIEIGKNVLIIFVMTLLSFLVILYTIMTPPLEKGFTEFYILNSTGKTYDYYVGNNVNILVGVVNHEYIPINYTVQIVQNNHILISENLSLNNDEKWQKKTNITLNDTNKKLDIYLYKQNDNKPYRTLYLKF